MCINQGICETTTFSSNLLRPNRKSLLGFKLLAMIATYRRCCSGDKTDVRIWPPAVRGRWIEFGIYGISDLSTFSFGRVTEFWSLDRLLRTSRAAFPLKVVWKVEKKPQKPTCWCPSLSGFGGPEICCCPFLLLFPPSSAFQTPFRRGSSKMKKVNFKITKRRGERFGGNRFSQSWQGFSRTRCSRFCDILNVFKARDQPELVG